MSPSSQAELVLCSPAAALPPPWLAETVALSLGEADFFGTLKPVAPVWLPRTQAEQDERFRQWIPYVLVRDVSGRLAAYPRGGTETRLHGCWSLGLGGHVNPPDAANVEQDWRPLLMAGLRREVAEEFPAAAAGVSRFLGLIHENRSAVGRVHIGAVFLLEMAVLDARPGEELAGLCWIQIHELGSDRWPLERFELWSRLALQLLPRS